MYETWTPEQEPKTRNVLDQSMFWKMTHSRVFLMTAFTATNIEYQTFFSDAVCSHHSEPNKISFSENWKLGFTKSSESLLTAGLNVIAVLQENG